MNVRKYKRKKEIKKFTMRTQKESKYLRLKDIRNYLLNDRFI